ncbi:MAG: hypothetical protein IJ468_04810 [Lachnospiraceae bacterium]|nr:hypothetical protein [Lachnospiraceae bacterium]
MIKALKKSWIGLLIFLQLIGTNAALAEENLLNDEWKNQIYQYLQLLNECEIDQNVEF